MSHSVCKESQKLKFREVNSSLYLDYFRLHHHSLSFLPHNIHCNDLTHYGKKLTSTYRWALFCNFHSPCTSPIPKHVYSLLRQELHLLCFGIAVDAGGPCLMLIIFGNNHQLTACLTEHGRTSLLNDLHAACAVCARICSLCKVEAIQSQLLHPAEKLIMSFSDTT